MKLPVRIFSDLHLGHRASRIGGAQEMRSLFRGAGTVVFNGDTWEELAKPWRENSGKMLAEMRQIISEEGCDSIFLRGNHDPGWDGPAWLELAEGRIIVTHGDALLRASSPWKKEILSDPELVEEIWREFPDAGHNVMSRLEIAKRIALKLRSRHYPKGRTWVSRVFDAALPPRRALCILEAWINQGKHGAAFCENYFPDAEILVLGHFHCASIRECGGRTVLNIGSFVIPDRAKWAEWDGSSLRTGPVIKQERIWKLGPEYRTWNLF